MTVHNPEAAGGTVETSAEITLDADIATQRASINTIIADLQSTHNSTRELQTAVAYLNQASYWMYTHVQRHTGG